jgi:hypothetical protein
MQDQYRCIGRSGVINRVISNQLNMKRSAIGIVVKPNVGRVLVY